MAPARAFMVLRPWVRDADSVDRRSRPGETAVQSAQGPHATKTVNGHSGPNRPASKTPHHRPSATRAVLARIPRRAARGGQRFTRRTAGARPPGQRSALGELGYDEDRTAAAYRSIVIKSPWTMAAISSRTASNPATN